MTVEEFPLRYSSQVEAAVLRTGVPDFELAQGAGLIANPDSFVFPVDHDETRPIDREIYGVTPISINRSGLATFRLATFGIEDPVFINQIEAASTNQIIQLGTHSDKTPKISKMMTSKRMMGALSDSLPYGKNCVGGVVVHQDESGQGMYVRTFMSERFSSYIGNALTNQLGKAGLKLVNAFSPKARNALKEIEERGGEGAVNKFLVLNNFATTISNARRRDDPVIVDKKFTAKV